MIFWIILTCVFFAFFVFVLVLDLQYDSRPPVSGGPLAVFLLFLVITTLLGVHARENKALYSDMAQNPQYYSVNDLKGAHKNIQAHKAHQGHWTSFYNGYEFPEIDVYVMDEVDQTIHIVK